MLDGILTRRLGNCLKAHPLTAICARCGGGENGKAQSQAGKAEAGNHCHGLILLTAFWVRQEGSTFECGGRL
jgi:hypothetical protein